MGSAAMDINMRLVVLLVCCVSFVITVAVENGMKKPEIDSQRTTSTNQQHLMRKPKSDRRPRSADGGQRKFQREAKAAFRGTTGAGFEQTQYLGECGNSGAVCGKPQVELKQPMFGRRPKVRGGFCTENGAVPWTVQIQVKEGDQYVHRCGGSLLSEEFVLTACHCFGAGKDKDIIVVLGQDDLNNSEDPGEVTFQVERYWLHEHFQMDGPYSHDLALIKLRKKGDGCGARFSSTVSPICLPKRWTSFQDNTTCFVSGWGKTKPQDKIHPECLRAAELPIMNHNQCKKMYAESSQNIIKEMICAGKLKGGVDACKGDSGGPLVCKDDLSSNTYMLAGVISWGLGCGKAYTPGVFTSVVHYLDWIEERMRQ